MPTNATREQEPDASTVSQQPTSEADGETVHTTGDWRLVVRAEGHVEARTHWPNGDPKTFTTAPTDEAPESSATYRYGKSIEKVLARYAHETRFERDPNEGEHGAALRRGIIDALCDLSVSHLCDHAGCDRQATHVCHVNAPTGPSTSLVCDDDANERTYVTLYALDSDTDTHPEVEG